MHIMVEHLFQNVKVVIYIHNIADEKHEELHFMVYNISYLRMLFRSRPFAQRINIDSILRPNHKSPVEFTNKLLLNFELFSREDPRHMFLFCMSAASPRQALNISSFDPLIFLHSDSKMVSTEFHAPPGHAALILTLRFFPHIYRQILAHRLKAPPRDPSDPPS
ncbi:hypothetical protein BJV82DRAFT_328934 [Fennellomyces sp. T-0311]|nr:hypothetical protein BJV82DRAFT_328934 [Fennellomyces sp. T-0311]